MKYYSVLIKAFATVVIEARNPEEASEIACDEVDMGDFQMEEGSVECEIKPDDLDSHKIHADKVINAEDYQ